MDRRHRPDDELMARLRILYILSRMSAGHGWRRPRRCNYGTGWVVYVGGKRKRNRSRLCCVQLRRHGCLHWNRNPLEKMLFQSNEMHSPSQQLSDGLAANATMIHLTRTSSRRPATRSLRAISPFALESTPDPHTLLQEN